jgi:hypothetical protein
MNIRGVSDVNVVTWKKAALDAGLSLREWVIGTLIRASINSMSEDEVEEELQKAENRSLVEAIKTIVPAKVYEPPVRDLTPEELRAANEKLKERKKAEKEKSFVKAAEIPRLDSKGREIPPINPDLVEAIQKSREKNG